MRTLSLLTMLVVVMGSANGADLGHVADAKGVAANATSARDPSMDSRPDAVIRALSNPASSKQSIPAQRIAFAGHGFLFDQNMKRMNPDILQIAEMQNSMMAEILKAAPGSERNKTSVIKNAQALLKSQKLGADENILIRGGLTVALLKTASEKITNLYAWRNAALLSYYWTPRPDLIKQLRPDIVDLLQRLGVLEPVRQPANQGDTTAYMSECRAHDVPIPPDWAESGTAWVRQGALTENLLDPGGAAVVWTYADPSLRGACIALPRDTGAPGSLAGIICQSATTGHACFWDNKLRGAAAAEPAMGWSGQRLVISELKDGSNLDGGSCTDCHRGDNVFLISPDDSTWAFVLRRLIGPRTGTFTTRVETSSDNRGGHPRYVPITTIPERPGWQNDFSSVSSRCTTCHEATVVSSPRRMPPLCARPSETDSRNCYGTP